MMSYLVIGLCIFLLLTVIIISIKPISMGIEARRDLKENLADKEDINEDIIDEDKSKLLNNDLSISDEIVKLNKLREDGVLSEEEYIKAKNKLLD